jgi:hypothetical protein
MIGPTDAATRPQSQRGPQTPPRGIMFESPVDNRRDVRPLPLYFVK